MHRQSLRGVALKCAGFLAVLAWSATLVVGVTPTSADANVAALWHMDETSGSMMHDSVGSHDGSLRSVVLGQSGFSDRAYGFTGSSKVTVPSASDLNAGSNDITITIHLRATSVPSKPDWDVIRKGTVSSSGGEWKMEYQPSGKASCGFKGKKSGELTGGPALNDGDWHSIQCVKTASSIKLIVDGHTSSKSIKIGTISNSAAIVIGSHGGSEFFQGSLDEASIRIG